MAKVRKYPSPPRRVKGHAPSWLERDPGLAGKYQWRRKYPPRK